MALPFVMDPFATLVLGGSAVSITAVGAYSLYSRFKTRQQGSEQESEVIKQHVKHELRLGRRFPNIKQNLIRTGHNEKLVREVIGMLELYHYVYHSMKRGHNSVKVKHVLLHWGWDEAKVNESILHASNRILTQKYARQHLTL